MGIPDNVLGPPLLISYTHTEPPLRPTATSLTVTPSSSPTQPLNPSNLVTPTPTITITTTNLPRSPPDLHHPWMIPIPPHTEQLRFVLNPSCQLWQGILEHFCPNTRSLCTVVSIVNHSPLHTHQTHIVPPLHIRFRHPHPFTHFP